MSIKLDNTAAIILAAGRGTRMKAKNKNKVVFKLKGRPIASYAVSNLKLAGVAQIIAVLGFQAKSVRDALGDGITYVTQDTPLGTGDAIKYALPVLNQHIDTVLSVYGDDSAFYPVTLYQDMVQKINESNCDIIFLTIHKDNPTGLGRIVRDEGGKVLRIVEEKNASDEVKRINEINTGFYCFKRDFLEKYIGEIECNPVTHEYYLTDLIEIALKNNKRVEALFVKDDSIWHGVNDRHDWAMARSKNI
mgnify:CR=1 FL=1